MTSVLLSGSREEMSRMLSAFLHGYYDFKFGSRKSLRTLRMIHYAGWLARRGKLPASYILKADVTEDANFGLAGPLTIDYIME